MIPEKLIKRLQAAKSVAVLTGAGVSAESGVATFRGENGIWKKFRPEEMANVDAFIRNPDLVWEWYQYRRQLIEETKPNPGHFALVEMEKRYEDFLLITQNVDGLHQRAGSQKVVELHGNILRNRCIECNKIYSELTLDDSKKVAPKCRNCGGLIRPDVVWFGEMLPEAAIAAANQAAAECEVFFSVGTSAVVYPAAALPGIAKSHGSFIVEINPEPTPVSAFADVTIFEKSGVALPKIIEELNRK